MLIASSCEYIQYKHPHDRSAAGADQDAVRGGGRGDAGRVPGLLPAVRRAGAGAALAALRQARAAAGRAGAARRRRGR